MNLRLRSIKMESTEKESNKRRKPHSDESATGDQAEQPTQAQHQQLPQHLLQHDQQQWEGAGDHNILAANALQPLGASISLPNFQQSRAFPCQPPRDPPLSSQSASSNPISEELTAILEPTPIREDNLSSASLVQAILRQQQSQPNPSPFLLQRQGLLPRSALLDGTVQGQIDSSRPTPVLAGYHSLPNLAMLQDNNTSLAASSSFPQQIPARSQNLSEQMNPFQFQANSRPDAKLPAMILNAADSNVATINSTMDTKVPSQFDALRHGGPDQQQSQPTLGPASAALQQQVFGTAHSPFQDQLYLPAGSPQPHATDRSSSFTASSVASFQQQGIGSLSDATRDNEAPEYGESTTTFQGKKKRMYRHESFPEKLFRLLLDLERLDRTDVASFKHDGIGFEIKQVSVFESDVLSKYFRHGKLSSFQRQLGLYGFARSKEKGKHGEMIISYVHSMFQRSKPHLCKQMKRIDY